MSANVKWDAISTCDLFVLDAGDTAYVCGTACAALALGLCHDDVHLQSGVLSHVYS